MSDTESNSGSNSNSSSNSNKAPKQNAPAKREKRKVTITDKVRGLFTEREKVRANLTAKLGKGARVANAATFYKKYPKAENRAEHINTFVTSIRERNAKAKANKPATKKNKATPAEAPAPAPAPAKKTTAKRGRPKLANAYKKNVSIEKQAKKLIEKAEAMQKELAKVNLKMEDICDLCKDFRPNTPPKA